jgi:hypothetical protein
MNYITGALVVPIADVNGTPFITPRVLDLDTEIFFPTHPLPIILIFEFKKFLH